MSPRKTKPLKERLESKLTKTPTCWLFTGARFKSGYGSISPDAPDKAHAVYAHRAAWMVYRGPIPEGTLVCHTCDNPPCCNPDHLFLGTKSTNALDMMAKGRGEHVRKAQAGVAKRRREATHCRRGHPFTEENTRRYVSVRGTPARACRTCIRLRERADALEAA